MKLSWRNAIPLVVAGLLLGGVVSAVAQDSTPAPGKEPTIGRAHVFKGGPHGRGLVRSESVVEGEEDGEFLTVRVDSGELASVDGSTLVIEEADGETVRVATDDETVVVRDGEETEISGLEEDDHVRTLRERAEGGDFETKHVMALSAERYEQLEQRHEACEQDPEQCRSGPGRHFRGPGPFLPREMTHRAEETSAA